MDAYMLTIGSLYAKYGICVEGIVMISDRTIQWAVTIFNYLLMANFAWIWSLVCLVSRLLAFSTKIAHLNLDQLNLRLRDHPNPALCEGLRAQTSRQLVNQFWNYACRAQFSAEGTQRHVLSVWLFHPSN